MDIEKVQTLEQVAIAIDEVEEARAEAGITAAERRSLEAAVVQLKSTELAIIRAKTNTMLAGLAADAQGLNELVSRMDKSSAKLAKVASIIEKVAKAIATLASLGAKASSAGLF